MLTHHSTILQPCTTGGPQLLHELLTVTMDLKCPQSCRLKNYRYVIPLATNSPEPAQMFLKCKTNLDSSSKGSSSTPSSFCVNHSHPVLSTHKSSRFQFGLREDLSQNFKQKQEGRCTRRQPCIPSSRSGHPWCQ